MRNFIRPDWPAPDNIIAFATRRSGGYSAPPFDSLNLGHHVGDAPEAVQANRALLAEALPRGVEPCWLQQVHGTTVVAAGAADLPQADASCSRDPRRACAILSADCLPVLLCSRGGNVIAAAHAGWRGLAAGVLEQTVAAMDCAPDELLVWFGPAIGPAAFEVGPEVRETFLQACGQQSAATEACFAPGAGRSGHYLADIYALARVRLEQAGVGAVYGGGWCTFSRQADFFSYRRDGRTGRMATVIAMNPGL